MRYEITSSHSSPITTCRLRLSRPSAPASSNGQGRREFGLMNFRSASVSCTRVTRKIYRTRLRCAGDTR